MGIALVIGALRSRHLKPQEGAYETVLELVISATTPELRFQPQPFNECVSQSLINNESPTNSRKGERSGLAGPLVRFVRGVRSCRKAHGRLCLSSSSQLQLLPLSGCDTTHLSNAAYLFALFIEVTILQRKQKHLYTNHLAIWARDVLGEGQPYFTELS